MLFSKRLALQQLRHGEGGKHLDGITEHAVPLQSDDPDSRYFVAWSGTDTDTWTYRITGLERYAANGQAWEYRIEEVRSETPGKEDTLPYYTPTPGTGSVVVQRTEEDAAGGGATLIMRDLTNSLATTAPYAKSWVDENGQILTEDYLGVPLRVELQLQVGVVHDGDTITWYSAEEYFQDESHMSSEHYKAIFGDDYAFTAVLEGELDSGVWGRQNAFEGLPARLVADGERLYYRVVETKVSYGSAEQTYTLHNSPDGNFRSILFVDAATHTAGPVCSREGCAHNDESCSAWLPGYPQSQFLFTLGGRLYIGQTREESCVWEAGENGEERRLLFQLSENQTLLDAEMAADDQYLYFQVIEENMELGEYRRFLYRIGHSEIILASQKLKAVDNRLVARLIVKFRRLFFVTVVNQCILSA